MKFESSRSDRKIPLGNTPTVGGQALTLQVLVRIQVPQPRRALTLVGISRHGIEGPRRDFREVSQLVTAPALQAELAGWHAFGAHLASASYARTDSLGFDSLASY